MPQFTQKRAIWGSAISLTAAAIFAVLYFQGIIWAGAESYEVNFTGGTASSSRCGWRCGSRSLYIREDQTFTASYEAQIRTGSLHFQLINTAAPFGKGTVGSKIVRSSGKGEFTVHVAEAGWYRLRVEPSPEGRGYDIEYSAHWRAHW